MKMKMRICVLMCILGLHCLSVQSTRSYSGFKLIEIEVTQKADIDKLVELQNHNQEVNFWILPKTVDDVASVCVPPEKYEDFVRQLNDAQLVFMVTQHDIQLEIEKEKSDIKAQSRISPAGYDVFNYHRHSEILEYLNELVGICGDKGLSCSTFSIGKSYEGRPLQVIKIGSSSNRRRPGLWIDAGIHAREWIAPATALIIANRLIYKYASDEVTKRVVDGFDWYILPSANPDGYEYTWEEDRLWRKTRSPNPGSDCVGTDPNRNWDFHWMETGASQNPCSEIYAGSKPFSEIETQGMSRFLLNKTLDFAMYISLHAYGQYWLTPWGYTEDVPDDYAMLEELGEYAAKTIKETYGKKFTVGSSTNVLYAAAGSSMDWAKAIAGIDMSLAAELRDKGNHGFVLPPSEIKQTGRETWLGVRAMALLLLEKANK